MPIYCPLCNRSSDEIRFVGNFCEPCVVGKLEKKIPESVVILQCRFCKRIKEGKTFSHMSNGSLSRALRITLNTKNDVKVTAHTGKEIDASFVTEVYGEKVIFNKRISYKVSHETCQRCYRISSGYYEAIAQLRGNAGRIDNLIAKITKYVQRRGGFIAKVDKVENGKDVYMSDKLMMNEFFHDYRLKPERSFRLYGMKRGKKLYRNTYSLHFDNPYNMSNKFKEER
ncbi:MAG: NMD3-related protein [Candidatus Micrarchaeaceae archaeon]